MLSLNPLIKLTIIILLIIVAGTMMSFALKCKIEKSAKKIYESRSMLKVLENRDENYALLKTNYSLVQGGLPALKRALPKEADVDGVVSSLETLAAETNNTQNLEFEPLNSAPSSGQIKSVNFTANLAGNIGSFEEYFKRLKNLPYPLELGGINIINDSGIFSNNSRLIYKARFYIKN